LVLLNDAFTKVAGNVYSQRVTTSIALGEERVHPKKIITEPDFTTPFRNIKKDGQEKFAAALIGGTDAWHLRSSWIEMYS
jgi:hypothetical protein